MVNIVYSQVQDIAMLRNLCVVQGIPIDEVAKKLRVPYNCVLHQLKTKLSEEEFTQCVRKRVRYTVEQKLGFLRLAEQTSMEQVSEQYGVQLAQLKNWKRRLLKQLALQPSL